MDKIDPAATGSKSGGSATSTSDGTAKAEEASAHSKDAVGCGRINIQMTQNVLLIWLDNNIDDNSVDCRNTITQLRDAVNTINTFTDPDQCVDFLTNIYSENICMIISGALCQRIVPLIHDVAQLCSIFIFCENKMEYEKWAKDWYRIKGIFTDTVPLCEALKKAAQQCEQDTISMSFIAINDDISRTNLDQLDASFMYTTIMKEILLTINFEQQHFMEFIRYCRKVLADNVENLKKVKKFEQKYRDKTPIWWYTFECFLYSMLNRALRLMDVDIIIKMGFFISDLHLHIKQLHRKQFVDQNSKESFTVYRGQGMSKTDFEQLTKTSGGLISFNNFLSTSKNREVSLLFAEDNSSNFDLVGILFVITINSSLSSTPFATIDTISHFQVEDEVLFAMHTVFRIGNITPMGESHRLFGVELTLTGDNDPDLRALTDCIREKTFPNSRGWYRLGTVLLKMGQSDKAQHVYEILLEKETEEIEKAPIYHQLGCIRCNQGKYQEAITFCEKSLKIKEKILSPNHPSVAMSYNSIGEVYRNMGEYSKAFSFYEKALAIRQQSLPSNHPDLAMSFHNIGMVYWNMSAYSKALSSYEKALAIRQKSLPSNHPDLAIFYNHMGLVHYNMGDYSKALSYYEKNLDISQKSLPPNHLALAMFNNSMGLVHCSMGNYSKALSSHEKALEIQQQSLPSNHPDLGISYNNMGLMHENMRNYSKALSYYEKALEIRQQSLPPNHPYLAMSYTNIGMVYYNMGNCSIALSSHEKALAIRQQSLPPNHPDLATSYNNIGSVYEEMGSYSKARSFYERAVEIAQQSLPSTHPNLQICRRNLDRVKKNL